MTKHLDTDRLLDAFLAPEADRLPDRVLDVALDDIARTPQRRALRVPWRTPHMPMPLRLAAAVALVAVVALVGLRYFGSPSVGSGPAPSCTSAPAPDVTPQPGATPLDRASWKTYVATQFGFSICYPADWVLRTGDMAPDPSHPAYDGLDPSQVHFVAGDESIFLSAWSSPVASGTTLDSVVRATCGGYQITCPDWLAHATPVSVDGHAGYVALLGSCTNPTCDTGWTEAYLLVDDRIYRVTSGRAPGEYDSDRLLRTFFSTMHLLPQGPVPLATGRPF
jgi:hypothetical protein